MESCDVLIDNGCCKGLAQLKKDDVRQLVRNASLSSTILKIKAELDQFMAGLDEAGVLHVIQKYPDLLRPMFVASGASRSPPLGFADGTLNFNHVNPYPTASTCAICLTLPTKYDSYDSFKEAFVFSMQSHGGFGLQ